MCIIVQHHRLLMNEKHNYVCKWDCLKCTPIANGIGIVIQQLSKEFPLVWMESLHDNQQINSTKKNIEIWLFNFPLNTLFPSNANNLSKWNKVAGGARTKGLASPCDCEEPKACHYMIDKTCSSLSSFDFYIWPDQIFFNQEPPLP